MSVGEVAPKPAPSLDNGMNVRRMVKVLLALFVAMAVVWGLCELAEPELSAAANVKMRPWQYIVIHHSATTGGSVDSIDRYHRTQLKFEHGIGYHFLIGNGRGMTDGQVATTQRWRSQIDGAHVDLLDPLPALRSQRGSELYNKQGIGVALVGDFDVDNPTPAQMDHLVELVYSLCQKLNIPVSHVVAHGELEATKCPGRNFPMQSFLRRLAEKYQRNPSN